MFYNNLSGLSYINDGVFLNTLIGPNQTNAAPIKGNLRFNNSTNEYQYYDGSTWLTLDTSASSSLWVVAGTGTTITPKSTYVDGIQIDKINSISGTGITISDDINCAGIISNGPVGSSSWLTGAFGLTNGAKIVVGTDPLGIALIGGHNSTLTAWAPLNIGRYNGSGTADIYIGGTGSNVYYHSTVYGGSIGCITANGILNISANGTGSLNLGGYTNSLANSGTDVDLGQNNKMVLVHGTIQLPSYAYKQNLEGSIVYNYSTHKMVLYNGTVWENVETATMAKIATINETPIIEQDNINIDKLFVNNIYSRSLTKPINIGQCYADSIEIGDSNKKYNLGMDDLGFYYIGDSVKYYLANKACNNNHNIPNDVYKYVQTRHKDIYNIFTELKKEIKELKKEIDLLKSKKEDTKITDEFAGITDLGNSLNFTK